MFKKHYGPIRVTFRGEVRTFVFFSPDDYGLFRDLDGYNVSPFMMTEIEARGYEPQDTDYHHWMDGGYSLHIDLEEEEYAVP